MKYQIIYADPPWAYSDSCNAGSRGAAHKYDVMALEEICALPVDMISEKDSLLLMWYTPPFHKEAVQVAESWGFKVINGSLFDWIKLIPRYEDHIKLAIKKGQLQSPNDFVELLNKITAMGMGNYSRANSEDVLIAKKGKGVPRTNAGVKQVVYAPRGRHSEKPREVRTAIETLFGNTSKVELFARAQNEGWDVWGNEVLSNVPLEYL